jgi:hypothetical protein
MSQGRERSKDGVPGRSLFCGVGYNLGVGHCRLRGVIGGEREGAVCSAVHVDLPDLSQWNRERQHNEHNNMV